MAYELSYLQFCHDLFFGVNNNLVDNNLIDPSTGLVRDLNEEKEEEEKEEEEEFRFLFAPFRVFDRLPVGAEGAGTFPWNGEPVLCHPVLDLSPAHGLVEEKRPPGFDPRVPRGLCPLHLIDADADPLLDSISHPGLQLYEQTLPGVTDKPAGKKSG